jgi:hypothetical protein
LRRLYQRPINWGAGQFDTRFPLPGAPTALWPMRVACLKQIQSDRCHRVVQPDHAMLMALQRCAVRQPPALYCFWWYAA